MMWGCKHKWKVLSEVTVPPKATLAMLRGVECSGHMAQQLLQGKVVQVCCCDKCGKIKHYETLT